MTKIFENKTAPRGMRTSGENNFHQNLSFDNSKNQNPFSKTQNNMNLTDFVDLMANETGRGVF